ncbi:hypothetical protein THII_1768 [Thioploca ingrica]|uniref:DUF2249 domain-containing protein n=1 Tax=Thioploca ingrica TaxID=40754 RepID=A0A090ALP6_9GAMM|nr:hypothetical protein THII_1768 [Thioploca ingrica]
MKLRRILDVSQLEPCEPLERVLATLPTLQPGEYLQVLHRMEPHLLYPILTRTGYAWKTKSGQTTLIEIYIWRSDDHQAQLAVQTDAA